MAKTTFWQGIDRLVNEISLFQNSGILILNLIKVDKVEGKTLNFKIEKEVPCPAPDRVTIRMIDGSRVCGGDMRTNIDYLTLKDIYSNLEAEVSWNETSGCIQEGTDLFRFGGVNYRIRSVIPEDWQDNMPGSYTLILENVSKAK